MIAALKRLPLFCGLVFTSLVAVIPVAAQELQSQVSLASVLDRKFTVEIKASSLVEAVQIVSAAVVKEIPQFRGVDFVFYNPQNRKVLEKPMWMKLENEKLSRILDQAGQHFASGCEFDYAKSTVVYDASARDANQVSGWEGEFKREYWLNVDLLRDLNWSLESKGHLEATLVDLGAAVSVKSIDGEKKTFIAQGTPANLDQIDRAILLAAKSGRK